MLMQGVMSCLLKPSFGSVPYTITCCVYRELVWPWDGAFPLTLEHPDYAKEDNEGL